MRWKSVALAGALWPVLAGCNLYYNMARNLANEPHVKGTLVCIEHELRQDAKACWQEVRAQYPRRAFTAEFRDGFLDGYVDYLDHGGNGSPLAVPPSRYTRHKKYYTEEGQCLLKHYLMGFEYGQQVAIATDRRRFLTVPALLPEEHEGPWPFRVEPHAAEPTPPKMTPPEFPVNPVVVPPGVPPAPPPGNRPAGPGLPTPRPLPGGPDAPPATKFERPTDPDALPAPRPPLPTPTTPAGLEVEAPRAPAVPAVKLPPPPPEVPTLPDYVPTPSILDELPVVPPTHTMPPPVPPHHPDPGK